jgi:HD-GYP domain-containing protein (c-di-GMP phosphodiesterase class II)
MFEPFKPQPTSFTDFSIDQLKDNSVTDFDLFLNVNDHVILYAGPGYKWVKAELESLLGLGHQNFLIRQDELRLAKMYQQLSQVAEIQHDQPPAQRIKSIEEVGCQFTKCLYEGEITPACVTKATEIASAIQHCVGEDRTCIKELTGLADHDYYTYYHSIRVATYAVAIAIEMGLSNEDSVNEVALGGIFHDVGKREVGLNIVNKTGALTESEWQVMREHPQYGFNNIHRSILSYVPREIILHHHEKLDGSGYPHGLDKNDLLAEVQITTVADIFDALTSTRSYQNKRSRYEALDFIKHHLVGSKLAADVYKALISCLK